MLAKLRLGMAAAVVVYGLTNSDPARTRSAAKKLLTTGAAVVTAMLVDNVVDRFVDRWFDDDTLAAEAAEHGAESRERKI
jgi:hypothetical protein